MNKSANSGRSIDVITLARAALQRIAVEAPSHYVGIMAPLMHKLCAYIVVLAIAVSFAAGASAWAMSGDMATNAAMADESSQTCDEGDCPDHSMAGATCDAVCSGTLAVFSTSAASHHWSDQDFNPSAMPTQIGQLSPPDPFPPRFSVLS